jgi:uncharacterized DUF497 family protein
MGFTWGETKRRTVLRRRRIDLAEIGRYFDGPNIDQCDDAHSNGEERRRRLIWLRDRVLVVIYTVRDRDIQLITAFKPTKEETRMFMERFFGSSAG